MTRSDVRDAFAKWHDWRILGNNEVMDELLNEMLELMIDKCRMRCHNLGT